VVGADERPKAIKMQKLEQFRKTDVRMFGGSSPEKEGAYVGKVLHKIEAQRLALPLELMISSEASNLSAILIGTIRNSGTQTERTLFRHIDMYFGMYFCMFVSSFMSSELDFRISYPFI
jgi:hypothetical protein